MKKTTNRKTEIDMALMVYSVALGFIGLFSMYNALEVYRKKDEVGKDLGLLVEKYRDSVSRLESRERSIKVDYKEIELRIKELKEIVKEDLRQTSKGLELKTDAQLIAVEEKLNGMSGILEEKQRNMEETIKKASGEFESFRKTMSKDFNRHYYTYTLYSLIPEYLLDKKNRIAVQSAFLWFGQNGNLQDLEILEERQGRIPADDNQLIRSCVENMEKLRRRLSGMEG